MRVVSIVILTLTAVLHVHAQQVNDVVVGDRPIVQRCVIKGSGARMIAVGSPGGFNFAFDAQGCLVDFCWYGDFLDFSGEIKGRGGQGCTVLGIRRSLGSPDVPLRIGNAGIPPESLRFRGYRHDAKSGMPVFLFEVDGVPVEQTVSSLEENVVTLRFVFPKSDGRARYFRIDPDKHEKVGLGDSLVWTDRGTIEIPGDRREASLTIHLKPNDKVFKRKVEKLSGEKIFASYCSACHSLDGSKLIGPTFKDFWGSERLVTRDGKEERVTVDRNYVIESIINPQAAVVSGYETVPMADFSAVLGKDDIERLADYLSGL